MAIELLPMQWPLPQGVNAAITLRGGGCSRAPYHSANFASHVGDDPAAVARNRTVLQQQLALPAAPLWLNQVHSDRVVDASEWQPQLSADGIVTRSRGQVCVAMGADCLPLLLCDSAGSQVAAVHVGWRGLAAGVVESALAHFPQPALLAYLGPAIGAASFEVGGEVCRALLAQPWRYHCAEQAAAACNPIGGDKYRLDLAKLVELRLLKRNAVTVFGGCVDTYAEPQRCFSYRRDGVTGRHAALIWMSAASTVEK